MHRLLLTTAVAGVLILSLFGSGLAAEKDDAEKDIAAGDEAWKNWDYAEAVKCYSRALEKDPLNSSVLAARGMMYARMGELDRAISDTTRAVQLDPDNAEAYLERGIAYGHRDQFDKAIADLSEAIRLDPDDAFKFGMRGDICVRQSG